MNSYYSYGRKGLIRHSLGKYNLHMYSIRLVLYVIALGTIGVLVINSAADGFARKQLMGLAGGLILMVILSFIDYNYICKYATLLYVINIIMLIGVKLLGKNVNGATRWFSLGPFGTLQPSEISKVFMLIIFAWIISENRQRLSSLRGILYVGILYMIPVGLIVIEPDLSTTLVFIFLFLILMFVGGLSWKIIAWIAGLAVPTAIFLVWYIQQPGQILLHDYQLDRVMSFLYPSKYLSTTYYQQHNSLMAIGSGMLTGKGLNNNTITSVKGGDFLAEPQTDFIFAVVGEEIGFIGSCLVIILIALITMECLVIAANARDMCGRLIASGAAAIIAFQSFVNIGVATAILPNTGLPLPFVSYGLSSLLSNCLLIGLVLNVGLQRNRR